MLANATPIRTIEILAPAAGPELPEGWQVVEFSAKRRDGRYDTPRHEMLDLGAAVSRWVDDRRGRELICVTGADFDAETLDHRLERIYRWDEKAGEWMPGRERA